MKTEKQIQASAAQFAERWKGKGDEKSESQMFWTDLLQNVFGVEDITQFIRYEERVKVDNTNFIDGHIPSTKVLIEQKSISKDLRKGILQSDGSVLNPFQQAKKYVSGLPLSEHPRWIVTCNFQEFLVYDMEQPNSEPAQIFLKDLGKEYYRLMFLVDTKSQHLSKEMEVSTKASKIIGEIHDALQKQYCDDSPEALRWLNILCVRIVFCLYAEDAGAFQHNQFHSYLARYEADEMRNALLSLFDVLNTPLDQRSRYLKDDLKAFPYTNGGLFEEKIEIPQFTEELKQTLLKNASLDFDWSEISPTIFGAMFESTLNPNTRRSGGMHYTSIENIHKVIDPLLLNDLRQELDTILEEKVERQRQKKLDAYQDKLASLTFLDPACGSGNFLTETYLSLRRLENEVIRERHHGQSFFSFDAENIIKVSIQQFYGIEINDFAVAVATTALWISEAQMLRETERIIKHEIEFLPLKSFTNIHEGNALRMDWMSVAPANLNYIMGNPPFVGAAMMSAEQKNEAVEIFGNIKLSNSIDYVGAWYHKAAQLMCRYPIIKTALVSTNSITQGEQVAALWQPLFERYNIQIIFAHRTFRWDSEASLKAHVHCVIVGFSCRKQTNNSPSKIEGVSQSDGGVCQPVRSNNLPYLKDNCRELRSHGTPAEGGLWNIIKGKQVDGLQFRRQFSIDNFILDFYCPSIRLAIELDGEYHYHAQMPKADYNRDEELMNKYGIKTLRFENKEVFINPNGIVNTILEYKAQYSPSLKRGQGAVINQRLPITHAPTLKGTPSNLEGESGCLLFDGDRVTKANNISPYLVDAPTIFIESRSKPLCNVPKLTKGNQPSDGGNLILSEEERKEFLHNDPTIECCIRRYIGARDYLNDDEIRYCLWLRGIPLSIYAKNKDVYNRLEAVRKMRAASTAAPTRAAANKPGLFFSMPQTDSTYLVIPRVSSERRRYIPIGFMPPEIIAADSLSIIPDATLYHFGVLTSNVHMAWMRTVCGRLKSDYRYSGSVVYNNFPWPNPTDEQKARIEETAQAILDARANNPGTCLAELYDEVMMPVELRKAHQDNDRAVMRAYGFDVKTMTESLCVAELFKRYQEIIETSQKS
ncbi:MAG: DNA methyltransferase [Bacteroidaceae bacterium]|nr:DNA methyltransferase [Bacteroidaceae bacterium]